MPYIFGTPYAITRARDDRGNKRFSWFGYLCDPHPYQSFLGFHREEILYPHTPTTIFVSNKANQEKLYLLIFE